MNAHVMNSREQLLYLIQYLIREDPGYSSLEIPDSVPEQKRLLRSLMNIRPPRPVPEEFIKVQDSYLSGELKRKKPVTLPELSPVQKGICLWQGDITRLQADAIVNAANSALLGCFIPCHGCIDNAIHSAAGVQLRLDCHRIMEEQGGPEPVGSAKITKAYNLPCRYVLHTVGPVIRGNPDREDCMALASCYRSCLELAAAYRLRSIAFCCISTGEFHFPNDEAAVIALETVKEYLTENDSEMEVVFNVYKDKDYEIYKRLLSAD